MKIFIDSADIEEIKQADAYGLVDGVTTNPSLIKKAAEKHKVKDLGKYIDQILRVAGKRPVSLEVKGGDAKEMIVQGKKLWKRFGNKTNAVYIKVPIDPTLDKPLHFEGLKAIKAFAKDKIPVNVTLIFTPEQALLAAKAGATVVSPFAGRIDDKIRKDNAIRFEKTDHFPSYGWHDNGKLFEDKGIVSGVDLVKQIVDLFKEHNIKTGVLAASLRNPRQVREVALVGATIATLPFPVIEQLTQHPKSLEGMQAFTADMVEEYEKLL